LKLSFQHDYRKSDVQVDVKASVGNANIICTEEQRQRLIALREKLLAEQVPANPNERGN